MLFERYAGAARAFVRANRQNIIRDIKRLVDVPSVEGTPAPGQPGEEAR